MKRYLADVNVWFALVVEEHQHHTAAREWLDQTTEKIGFIRITQLGLLRLLTTPAAMNGKPLTNKQAWQVYDALLADERIHVFPELTESGDERFRSMSAARQASPKIWVDAYLAAAAKYNEAILVSFDRAFRGLGIECSILGA